MKILKTVVPCGSDIPRITINPEGDMFSADERFVADGTAIFLRKYIDIYFPRKMKAALKQLKFPQEFAYNWGIVSPRPADSTEEWEGLISENRVYTVDIGLCIRSKSDGRFYRILPGPTDNRNLVIAVDNEKYGLLIDYLGITLEASLNALFISYQKKLLGAIITTPIATELISVKNWFCR